MFEVTLNWTYTIIIILICPQSVVNPLACFSLYILLCFSSFMIHLLRDKFPVFFILMYLSDINVNRQKKNGIRSPKDIILKQNNSAAVDIIISCRNRRIISLHDIIPGTETILKIFRCTLTIIICARHNRRMHY